MTHLSELKLPDLGPLEFPIVVRKQLLDCYASAVEFCQERGADVSWLRIFDLGYEDGYEIIQGGGWKRRKPENNYAEGAWLLVGTDPSSDSDSAKDSLLALGFPSDRILLRRERGRWYQSVYVCCWTEYKHEFEVLQVQMPEIRHPGRTLRLDEIMPEKPTVTLLCTICNTRFESKNDVREHLMGFAEVRYEVDLRGTQHFPKCRGPQSFEHKLVYYNDIHRGGMGGLQVKCLRCEKEIQIGYQEMKELSFSPGNTTKMIEERFKYESGQECQPLIKIPMIGPFPKPLPVF